MLKKLLTTLRSKSDQDMTTPTDLHRKAMEAYDMFLSMKLKGQEEAIQHGRSALRLEIQALDLVPQDVQPSYSVLCRSAATIALQVGEKAQAEQLVRRGLDAPAVPGNIREELLEVLGKAMKKR